MRYLILFFFVLPGLVFAQDTPSKVPELVGRVDPRVELMSLIFRLSGSNEYNQSQSMSSYSRAAEDWFGDFRKHPVVKAAQELRADRGVGFDAVMEMALHITNTKTLKEKIPFDRAPEQLDKRWELEGARDFLEKARDFVEESRFNDFVEKHSGLYEKASRRMTEHLGKHNYIDWFDKFFGTRPGAEFSVIVGLFNGPCNYGTSVRYLDGSEEVSPVIGAANWDGDDVPVFTDAIVATVVHEFCHSYINPLVDKYEAALAGSALQIFVHCREVMERQAYKSWRIMMYESLVRTCVARYIDATKGKKDLEVYIKEQHGRGFQWVGDLDTILAIYERKRERYPDFDAFMPEVVEFFEGYSEEYGSLVARAPKVVSMVPLNGATDVDPGLTEIKVTFDRPMRNGGWSVCGEGSDYPEVTGMCFYDKECMVFTLPVRLKPDWSYKLWLNYGQSNNFKSKDGIPLASAALFFKTRKK